MILWRNVAFFCSAIVVYLQQNDLSKQANPWGFVIIHRKYFFICQNFWGCYKICLLWNRKTVRYFRFSHKLFAVWSLNPNRRLTTLTCCTHCGDAHVLQTTWRNITFSVESKTVIFDIKLKKWQNKLQHTHEIPRKGRYTHTPTRGWLFICGNTRIYNIKQNNFGNGLLPQKIMYVYDQSQKRGTPKKRQSRFF